MTNEIVEIEVAQKVQEIHFLKKTGQKLVR